MPNKKRIKYDEWIHMLSKASDIEGILNAELDMLPEDTSTDTIKQLISTSPEFCDKITKKVFDSFIDLINIKVMESPNNEFFIPNFGTFLIKMHKGHKVKLLPKVPVDGGLVEIPDYKILRFVPDKKFKDEILMKDEA